MEEELIALKKELYDLDDIEGDVWKYVNDWKKRFWAFINKDENKTQYGWCEAEFENIKSINKKSMEDSFRVLISIYKELFKKIESKEYRKH